MTSVFLNQRARFPLLDYGCVTDGGVVVVVEDRCKQIVAYMRARVCYTAYDVNYLIKRPVRMGDAATGRVYYYGFPFTKYRNKSVFIFKRANAINTLTTRIEETTVDDDDDG